MTTDTDWLSRNLIGLKVGRTTRDDPRFSLLQETIDYPVCAFPCFKWSCHLMKSFVRYYFQTPKNRAKGL